MMKKEKRKDFSLFRRLRMQRERERGKWINSYSGSSDTHTHTQHYHYKSHCERIEHGSDCDTLSAAVCTCCGMFDRQNLRRGRERKREKKDTNEGDCVTSKIS